MGVCFHTEGTICDNCRPGMDAQLLGVPEQLNDIKKRFELGIPPTKRALRLWMSCEHSTGDPKICRQCFDGAIEEALAKHGKVR